MHLNILKGLVEVGIFFSQYKTVPRPNCTRPFISENSIVYRTDMKDQNNFFFKTNKTKVWNRSKNDIDTAVWDFVLNNIVRIGIQCSGKKSWVCSVFFTRNCLMFESSGVCRRWKMFKNDTCVSRVCKWRPNCNLFWLLRNLFYVWFFLKYFMINGFNFW